MADPTQPFGLMIGFANLSLSDNYKQQVSFGIRKKGIFLLSALLALLSVEIYSVEMKRRVVELLTWNERLVSSPTSQVCFDMAAVGSCTVAHFETSEGGERRIFRVRYGVSFVCELKYQEQRIVMFDEKEEENQLVIDSAK